MEQQETTEVLTVKRSLTLHEMCNKWSSIMEQQETTEVLTVKRSLTLHEMARMQDELNKRADPSNPDWISARTPAQFNYAARVELTELADSGTWKWWKKGGEVNEWNVKIEVVDIVHFLLSKAILVGYPAPAADTYPDFQDNATPFFDENGVADVNYIDALMTAIGNQDGASALGVLCTCCYSAGMTLSEMSAIYLAKYTLNEIRYEGGYYADEYAKYKEGVEDNELLEGVIDQYLADEMLSIDTIPNLVRNTITGTLAGPA